MTATTPLSPQNLELLVARQAREISFFRARLAERQRLERRLEAMRKEVERQRARAETWRARCLNGKKRKTVLS